MINITRYRISFCADNDIHLQSYAGSALRGMFGHALKSMACPTANGRSCRCQGDCLYRTLFDPPQTHTHDRKQDTPPPFIVEAHSLPRHIKAGQTAYFYMTLIGKVAHSEQMMIELAWRRALSVGFDQKDKTKATAKFIGMSKFDSPFGSPIKPMPPTALILDLFTPTRIPRPIYAHADTASRQALEFTGFGRLTILSGIDAPLCAVIGGIWR